MHDVQDILSIGTIIRERYAIKNLIGSGSSGAVYRAVDLHAQGTAQKIFALKEVTGLDQQERLQRMFKGVALKQINHPALPTIHHMFNEDKQQRVYIVMDYIEGPDLETLWQQQPKQRLTASEVLTIMTPIFHAVRYLHQQETPLVHGDIKPVTILLAQPENIFMLVDCSIAKAPKPDASMLLHTASYKAPEQYAKNVDRRADIYGFAATCYALLTGVAPINALARQAQVKQGLPDPLHTVHTLVPAMPLHISQAIHRAMSLLPDQRFSTIEGFWQALQPSGGAGKPPVKLMASPETPIPASIVQKKGLAAHVKKSTTNPAAAEPLGKQHKNAGKGQNLFQKYTVLFSMLVLLLLIGATIGIWSLTQGHSTNTSGIKHSSITPLAYPTIPSTAANPIATPTSAPGKYPSMVGSYTGTLVDISKTVSTTIILQGIHQVNGNISGYLTSGSSLKISGSFTGTIDTAKHLQFTVTDNAGHPMLFIEGAMQTATSLSGDFYRCAPTSSASIQPETCVRATSGYGIWNALLVPPNS